MQEKSKTGTYSEIVFLSVFKVEPTPALTLQGRFGLRKLEVDYDMSVHLCISKAVSTSVPPKASSPQTTLGCLRQAPPSPPGMRCSYRAESRLWPPGWRSPGTPLADAAEKDCAMF